MLAKNLDLPKNTIEMRESMHKFKSNDLELEILDYNKYRCGFLNRQVIILLSSLGVPDSNFIQI